MSKYVWFGLMIAAVVIVYFNFLSPLLNPSINVIKYFPIDETKEFQSAETTLTFNSEKDSDEYEVQWAMRSDTRDKMYLRQDVSLLYVNGQLKGIMNKWRENTNLIEQQSILNGEDSSLYQAITIHHGEIHYPEDIIKSIQTLTHDQLYVIDSPHTALESFHKPETNEHKEWVETINHSVQQQLDYQWDALLSYFNIPVERYVAVPLTKLYQYQEDPIPGVDKEESKRILGQLWEGLYKNYVMGISDSKSSGHPIQSYVPLILFDKEGKHLLVLFEDDQGNKEQLIQYYSDNLS
ncbi:hypothetical protein [Thalassobacillus pellis]|uniref:hypothetical protein n=1 Tax=Thalassobacillus pellis TaxID=748008 RepID=UPI0019609FEC|nr:hypothetical protein [Thalassobacillus pellis]MBM7552285.1 hypothetical protein [Thalassobacillus pellis]